MALPTPVVSKRSIEREKISAEELDKFMKLHGISEREMAEIIGVTVQGVRFWLSGERDINVTVSRVIRLFQKDPKIIREF